MIFKPTRIDDLSLIVSPPSVDARGAFTRMWCADTFEQAGYSFVPLQISIASNFRTGTLRGLHWQAAPHGESKLIQVLQGRIWDVIVDLRSHSPTRFAWQSFDLEAESGHSILAPPGCAHGYITLTEETKILYAMDARYMPASARGARWNDPAFAIRWPMEPRVISDRDANWPDFRDGANNE